MIAEFNIFVSGIAPYLWPTETMYGMLWFGKTENDVLEIPQLFPYSGEWGERLSTQMLLRETFPMPSKLDMVWLSIVEQKFYYIENVLPTKEMEEKWSQRDDISDIPLYTHIVVGMAPYGNTTIWFVGDNKSILIDRLKATEVKVNMSDFVPNNPTITLEDYCNFYINNNPRVKENQKRNGLPPHNIYEKYEQQFTYRYSLIFEKWDYSEKKWIKYSDDKTVPAFEYIEEALFDGTHDKLHDDGLLKYHEAGKPKKISMKWHIEKSEYTAYFWFEDEKICSIYDKFYGAHPETKVDFIIHIDAEKKKYELALYRYGLKEPQIIPEDTYQLIVFKNKFEHYRSENYNQPRGAWIW